MQEISVEGLEQIERLVEKLEASPEVLDRVRREAFARAAEEAKRLLDSTIAARLNGDVGEIQRWQEAHVGSRGGYAAVRPRADTWTEATRKEGNRYAVGAVTNAINSGHAFPRPSGRNSRYRPRIRISEQKVPARPFYTDAQENIRPLAQHTAEEIVRGLMKHLEE